MTESLHKTAYNIYIDESSIDNPKNQFMIIWGLFLKRDLRHQVREEIKIIKKNYNFNIELKRSKINKKVIEPVKKILDTFFEYVDSDLWFHCIVVDKRKVDYKLYHNDDKELAFYKFIYHLLKHKFSYNTDYYLFLDFKQTRVNERILNLKQRLSSHVYFESKNTKLQHVQAYDSSENTLLQISDLLIGAVWYCYNWYFDKKVGNSDAKKEIVEYILSKLHKSDLKFASLPSEKKFNIYKINLWQKLLSNNKIPSC